MPKMTKELEDKISEFQVLQSQLQMIAVQRQQTRAQNDEASESLQRLETASGKVYMFSGTLFLESTKDEAKKEVEERLEMFKVRDTALAKQEDRVKKRVEDLRKDLESSAGLGGG